ncbi:tyrosine-type recombinase/integrase [Enterobacter ludwigii]
MKVNAVTAEQAGLIEKVLRRNGQDTYADVWRLNLNMALRISDLLALKFDDVKGNVLRLNEQKTARKAKGDQPAKPGKVKTIEINDVARSIIEKRRQVNPDDVFLFQSKSNRVKGAAKPVTREAVSRAFKAAGEEVCGDSRNVGTHSARKTRARIIYEDTKDIALVSKMLNHSSIRVTETYLDIRQDDVNASYHTYQL